MAVPAEAAAVGTVTVAYDPGPMNYTVTPSTLAGAVGDTFTLADTMTSADNNPAVYVSLQDQSGAVSLGASSCAAATDCPVLDLLSGGATGVFTIDAPGTVKVMRADLAAPSQIGTLTITAGGGGGGGGGSAATAEYTFRYERPDGSECAAISPQTVQKGWVALPGKDADCTTGGLAIVGWRARGSDRVFPAGMQVNASADQVFTVVLNDPKVWIETDANVPPGDACLNAEGENVVDPTKRVDARYASKRLAWLPLVAACGPENQRLIGWNTSADGQGRTYRNPTAVPADELFGVNVLYLYAIWQPAEGTPVTITWRPTGGTCKLSTTTVPYGSSLVPPEGLLCKRPGMHVVSWRPKADGSGRDQVGRTLTKNTVVYAMWERDFTLTARWNTLPKNAVPCADTITSGGSPMPLPDASTCTTAYALRSWNTLPDGSGISFAPGGTVPMPTNLTIYAQWDVPITYAPAGGTCSVTRQLVAYGTDYTIPREDQCTKSGMALSNWKLPNLPDFPFAAGSTYPATMPLEFTAQWGAPITLTFEGNGGTCTVQSRVLGEGGLYSLPASEACSRSGFGLGSWLLKGSALSFPAGSGGYTTFAPLTFVAQWQPEVTVTYEANGGSCSDKLIKLVQGSTLTLPGAASCTKEGSSFVGWRVTKGAAAGKPLNHDSGGQYVVVGETVLRARWTEHSRCDVAAKPGVDWHDCDKRNAELRGANLTNANLNGTDFTGADLQDADLRGSTTQNIVLDQAVLAGTHLNGLDLRGGSASLVGAVFVMYDCDATGECSSARRKVCEPLAFLHRWLGEIKAVDFSDANLSGQVLRRVDMTAAQMSRTNLRGVDFKGARLCDAAVEAGDLDGLSLKNADVQGARFVDVDMRSVDLSGTIFSRDFKVPGVSFMRANFSGKDLSGQVLGAVSFMESDLSRANMSGSSVDGAVINESDLAYGRFSGIGPIISFYDNDASYADLSRININGYVWNTNFSHANLEGANLALTDLSLSRFPDANLKNATVSNPSMMDCVLSYGMADVPFTGATLKGARFNLLLGTNFDPSSVAPATVTFASTAMHCRASEG